jgi:hypothetical protein
MSEEKKVMNGQELENSAGGNSRNGWYLTVGDCNGTYLALRPQPVWDQYHEIMRLYPGYQVWTFGEVVRGTGLNGIPCNYTYVSYNGKWGWANSSFLR